MRWTARAVVLLMLCPDPVSAEPPASEMQSVPTSPLIVTQVPVTGRVGRSGQLPPGSRIVRVERAAADAEVRVLTNGFAAAGKPDVSFDGTRVLFVGRRAPDEPLAVWEMTVEGTNIRRLVSRSTDCDQPIYLSTLYRLDADQPVYQIAFLGRPAGEDAASLYTCRRDGTDIRRISFAPQGVADPLILSDGRLIFSSCSPPASSPDAQGSAARERSCATALFSIHTDGTDLFPFAGVHGRPLVRGMGCETRDGLVVYVESADRDGDRGGALAAVARTRSLHTHRVIARDDDGAYRSPSPLPNGQLLVSFRPRSGASYGLYLLNPKTGRRVSKVFDDPAWHEVDGALVRARLEPDGRASVVDARSDVGQLYCLDAYLSDRPEARAIARGRIRGLRVIQAGRDRVPGPGSVNGAPLPRNGFPRSQAHGSEMVLGEVPVEPDGSVFLEVPARVPLRLETLDENGRILQAMRSWMWVMPGERRGCIGCHEDRELSPPNRHVLALRKPPVRVGLPRPVVSRRGRGLKAHGAKGP